MRDFSHCKFEDTQYPKQVVIETTTSCNQACKMCAHKDMIRPKGTMSLDTYLRIVEEIGSWPTQPEVWLTFYGDALLLGAWKLFYLIQAAYIRGCDNLVLNTNGVLLDKDRRRILVESPLSKLIVSIDAATEGTYRELRGSKGHRLSVISNNVLEFLKDLETVPAPYSGPQVIVQFSEMEENKHERAMFTEFWGQFGVSVKTREKLSWTGSITAPNLESDLCRVPCGWALSAPAILWDGRVVVCACDHGGRGVVGDIYKQSLSYIWRGAHSKFRRIHLDRRWDDLPLVCQGCQDWQTTGSAKIV